MKAFEALFGNARKTSPESKSSSAQEENSAQHFFDEQDSEFFDSFNNDSPVTPPGQPADKSSSSLKGDSHASEGLASSEEDGQGIVDDSSGTEDSAEVSELRRRIAELEDELKKEKQRRLEEAQKVKELKDKLKEAKKENESQKKKTIKLLQVAFGKKGEKLKNLSAKHKKDFFSALLVSDLSDNIPGELQDLGVNRGNSILTNSSARKWYYGAEDRMSFPDYIIICRCPP